MKPLDDNLTTLVKEETFYLERVQQEVQKRIVGQHRRRLRDTAAPVPPRKNC